MAKLLIATMDTQTKNGRFVRRGETVSSDEVDYNAKTSTNLIPAPKGAEGGGVVQVSAIAPTGPNPTAPQQIGPGTVQTVAGYVDDKGNRLVGEVTSPAKVRIKDAGLAEEDAVDQEAIDAALAKAEKDAAEAKAAEAKKAAEAEKKAAAKA